MKRLSVPVRIQAVIACTQAHHPRGIDAALSLTYLSDQSFCASNHTFTNYAHHTLVVIQKTSVLCEIDILRTARRRIFRFIKPFICLCNRNEECQRTATSPRWHQNRVRLTSSQMRIENFSMTMPCKLLLAHDRYNKSSGSSCRSISYIVSSGISVISFRYPRRPRTYLSGFPGLAIRASNTFSVLVCPTFCRFWSASDLSTEVGAWWQFFSIRLDRRGVAIREW